eukprot:scaffold20758_cov74-Cyclotella_meneghiniana.AAC.8
MKATTPKLLSAAVMLVAGVKSNAKSSVRGGAPSDHHHVADDSSSSRMLPKRRALQKNERRQLDVSSYWWLSKESSEKDIVYKPSAQQQQGGVTNSRTSGSTGNGMDSFAVFTIDVDNNPDTSELPYRAPTKLPTAKPTSTPTALKPPTSSPTETAVTDSPITLNSVELVSPQEIAGRTKSLDEDSNYYYFPLWTDVYKGCVSSTTPPQVYSYFPDEYIFTSVSTCCTLWFGSEDCSSNKNGMTEKTFMDGSNYNMDEYMFRSNGIEAYSGGGATTSRDDSNSRDDEEDGRPSPLVPPPSPSVTDTLPPVTVVVSEEPTYKPTAFSDGDDLGVSIITPPPGSSPPPVSFQVTDPPVSAPQAVGTLPPVDDVETSTTPEPTPAPIIPAVFTPYPTFGALPVAVATAPPVFEIVVETNAPTVAGTGNSTIAGTDAGTAAGTAAGTISKRTVGMKDESESMTRLFSMRRHRKSDDSDD